jgi:hypothetical protein
MKAVDYQNLMHKHLLNERRKIGGRGWIYQQDNASFHGAKSITEWFKKKVRVMEWARRSPDMNLIEN